MKIHLKRKSTREKEGYKKMQNNEEYQQKQKVGS